MKLFKDISILSSALYIVPTPIGNLQDITFRAIAILRQVDCIITESIYRARILLNFFSIRQSLFIMNRYNEHRKTPILIERLRLGQSMALISDAGTPVINDPGYYLVQSCHDSGIKIVPLPGPCSIITALSSSGFQTNSFCFEGFLPSKKNMRINFLKKLSSESRTLIFFDTKHRVIDSLGDMINVFGPERYVVLARELTKVWESIYKAPIGQLLLQIQKKNIRGEVVLVVSGSCSKDDHISDKVYNMMNILSVELSVKRAAVIVGRIYGIKKDVLYKKYINKHRIMSK